MKKKRIYSMWAKMLAVLVLLASTVLVGICGSWILFGLNRGMNVKEIQDPVPYVRSEAAANYLLRESNILLETRSEKAQYYKDGDTYDENATIDISDLEAGVRKEKKDSNFEYSLKSLEAFYESKGYVMLSHLMEAKENYIYSDVSEETVQSEVLGKKAQPSQIVTASAAMYNERTNVTTEVQFRVKCYREMYNVLYNNGIEIEKHYIQNASGKTIAEYAQKNLDMVSIEDSYEQLLSAAAQVHNFLEDASNDTNARIFIRNTQTGESYSNEKGWSGLDLSGVKKQYLQECAASEDDVLYYLCDENIETDGGEEVSQNNQNERILYDGRSILETARQSLGEGKYQIFIGLDTNYPLRKSDSYRDAQIYEWYESHQPLQDGNEFYLFFVGLAAAIISLVILSCQTGHRPGEKGIHLAAIDAFPIEILLIADIVLWVLVFVIAGETSLNYSAFYDMGPTMSISEVETIWQRVCFGFTASLVLAASALAWEIKHYGRRLKAKELGGSLIKSFGSSIKKAAGAAIRGRKENEKLILAFVGFVAIHFVLLTISGASINRYGGIGVFVFLWLIMIVFDIFILFQLMKSTNGRDEIKKGMEAITEGNLDYKINTERMSGDNLVMADELNRVRDGLKQAVEAEMKSERLKTDLITNVSHDIKTPLTSIINYVDILKRENIQDEKISGYIDILDRKAQRLKQLTEDLVEASKISSGNITLEMQEINLKQLIKQTNGEFEEKFAAKNLELVCSLPESEMLIRADGRRMFRVIENLYNNAAKYAMPNSRVYVNGELTGQKVIFSMKNMSESPLNFKADELLERFVRGDVSRSTEGSGLGLEIARNLTVMQEGTFDLYLDGDLFKVTVTFDAIS